MKKLLFTVMLSLALVLSASGCSDKLQSRTIVIAVPDGAPVLAIYDLLGESSPLEGYDVKVNVLSGSSNIAQTVTAGDADIAVMPTNAAAKLYNNGVDIKLFSVNVFGVLYVVGTEPATTFSDLVGKRVCNIGRGMTPDLTMKFLLDNAGVEYVESDVAVPGKVALRYVGDGPEAIALKKAGACDYLVLGEPVVTQASKVIGTSVAIDLQKEWAAVVGENSYMQAGIVVNKRVYEDEYLIGALTEKLTANAAYLAENYASAKDTLKKAGSALSVDFTPETVERLNVGFMSAKDSKSSLEKYFGAIEDYDPTFIGGKLPEVDFYYGYEG